MIRKVMERRIRKFKRRYPKDNYGKEHKQTMNNLNFRCKRYEPLESEFRCEIIKRSPLSKKLKQFPKDIQYKIYVFTMKNFWKKICYEELPKKKLLLYESPRR